MRRGGEEIEEEEEVEVDYLVKRFSHWICT
jgi:hypothetical protein